MKLFAFWKLSVISMCKNFPTFVLSYAIYPIILSLIMSYTQQDMFTPKINNPIISIAIVDKDNSTQSKNLSEFLTSTELSSILTLSKEDENSPPYTIVIPQGYEKSLLGDETVTVNIEADEKAPISLGNVLINLISQYNHESGKQLRISDNINKMEISQEAKEILSANITKLINGIYLNDTFTNEIHETRTVLNSFEHFSISFISFSFIVFVMAIIAGDSIEKENGMFNRVMSTPITRLQYFNYSLVSNYFMMLVICIIYVGSYRLLGLSFNRGLPNLLIIVLVQSLMITLTGSFISKIFKKKYGLIIVQTFLIFQVLFGGMSGVFSQWSNNKLGEIIEKIKPDLLISDMYRNYMIYDDIAYISNYIFIALGISLVLYILNVLALKFNWGLSE